jgi:hypothetical protein
MRSFPVSMVAIILALASIAAPAFAQEEASPLASTQFSSFERGDGILSLTLGTTISLGFYDPSSSSYLSSTTHPGFAFSLSYAGFLNESWALAGDLAGGFISTVNDRRLFIAPLALRAVRAFPIGAFVIAPSAGLGLAISALNDSKHADALFKFGSTFLWRASSDMSYGLNLFGTVIPQIYSNDPDQNRVGFFFDATLSVAYHL